MHIFIGRVFGHPAKLIRLSFSPNMQDVLLSKHLKYPLGKMSTRSTAIVISPAHFRIIDVNVSQSFPLPTLRPGSHLS